MVPIGMKRLLLLCIIFQVIADQKPVFDERSIGDAQLETNDLEEEGHHLQIPPALQTMFNLFVKALFGPGQTESCLTRMKCEMGALINKIHAGPTMLKYLVKNYLPSNFQYLEKVIREASNIDTPCSSIPCERFQRKEEL